MGETYWTKNMPAMKVLCYTPTINRHKFARACIYDAANQSYPCHHAVNVCYNEGDDLKLLMEYFNDVNRDNTTVVYSTHGSFHENYIGAIKGVNYQDFDLFVGMDDDDIYKKNYVKNIVERFEKGDVDVVTTYIDRQLNGNLLRMGHWDNLGANPDGYPFRMPNTFAFNRKCLDIILNIKPKTWYSDLDWRRAWAEKKVRLGEVDNEKEVVWHIHGKNASTSHILIKNQQL